ncbi:hypothetical protein [Corallibacter sp.]|uniref:hypothetical protein n=1 Tax=Corallibacter sp. TaxID=2038084 RepID=UPI003A9442FC
MALNKAELKSDIKSILEDMMQRENTSIDEFATRLSDSIDSYVKGAEINYTQGLTGYLGVPVTGVFEGNLQ